ncbi:hydroxyethylthiazole kinase [Desulfatiferula olefinivorans]
MTMKAFTRDNLETLRERSPLVHNITNFVAMNVTANILLSIGASPVMAHSRDEVADMVSLADALVLNIGTLEENWVSAMITAGRAANDKGIPVILDPVGSGATAYRTRSVRRILDECRVSVLRGNASEVLSLSDVAATTKGVDSSLGLSDEAVDVCRDMAGRLSLVVAVSGEEDCITDGRAVYRVRNGHPMMARVTGLGCGLSSVVGAFCAVCPDDLLRSAAAAFGFYGLCGEMAARLSKGPGSFETAFLDTLYLTGTDEVQARLKIIEA